MQLLTVADADARGHGLKVVPHFHPDHGQRSRIIEALGPLGEHSPSLDEETLSRYYRYLSARLSFPFAACYPEPTTSIEELEYHCVVLELLDPVKDIYDEFDGIFCKTQKGKYETNLPLIELDMPKDSPNFQFIEDYWYWFWNWR